MNRKFLLWRAGPVVHRWADVSLGSTRASQRKEHAFEGVLPVVMPKQMLRPEDIEALIAESAQQPVLVFKHSTT